MTQRRGQVFDVPTKHFNGLPEEIKFLIFMAMDVRTLVLSCLICRSWKISIDNPSLNYKIELAVSGVTEGPPRTHEIGKRTNLLKGNRAAWRNLVWNELAKIPAAPQMAHSWTFALLRDNVFAQRRKYDPTLYLTRIPSRKLAATKWESWTVQDVHCQDFTMDPSQDLLVSIETTLSSESIIHLRSLTTGVAHPLARHGVFHLSLSAYDVLYDAQIVQDHLGVFIYHPSGEDRLPLIVWNWKTGDKILEIISDRIYALTFLDEFHILVASFFKEKDGACISVYDLPSRTPARPRADEEANRCAFLLPGIDLYPVYVRCCPSSARQSVFAYSHPEDRPDSIVTITAFCNSGNNAFDSALKITAPASRLRRLIADAVPGQQFAWHEWGLTDTHVQVDTGIVVPQTRHFAAARFDYISGMRSVKLTEDFSRLCVYDFSPLRVSRYIHGTDRETTKVPKDNPSRDVMLVHWNARALHAQLPVLQILPTAGDTDERACPLPVTSPLPVLQTSIELPEKLRNLDLTRSNVLITDDAIVIHDPSAPDFIYVMRF